MTRPAYGFVRTFGAEPARELCVDRHYLLYARAGALRLEAGGRAWTLPPARAALVEAGYPVRVTIPRRATTSSVLFAAGFVPPPPTPLAVFDMTPLARALVAECARWGEDGDPPPDGVRTLFAALAVVTWELAERPDPLVVPTGRSPEVRAALELTAARLADPVRFEDVAAAVGLVPRSLARRFEGEVGDSWRAVLRRMRVLRAVELLAADDAPVTAIAHAVGYTSLSAFNAAFRELTGRTPSAYRASFRP